MTKLYRFTQTLDGYKEPYYQIVGTLEEVLQKWCQGPWPQHKGEYLGYSVDFYNSLYFQILGHIEKQGMFIEIVDESLYGMGWVTKIREVE